MAHVDYSAAGIPIRDDLTKSHVELLEHLRAPGTWWTGADRLAIAAESRHALDCALCRERKDALSPSSVKGEHDSLGALPEETRALQRSSDAHYVAMRDLANPNARRDLDRLQIELVAARVSALNECFY